MSKIIRYIGAANRWPELAATGKQSMWLAGQQEERSDAEAAQLMATGFFIGLWGHVWLNYDGKIVDKNGALVDGGGSTASLSVNPSSKYLRFYPFKQYNGTGLPRDYSTNAKALYPMTGYAESSYWGTPGYLTTAAAANSGLVESNEDLDLSITDAGNLLMAFEITKAAPAAEEGFMGWSSVGTSGVRYYATTAGKLKMVIQDDLLSTSTLSATTATVFDGTPHSVQVFFNNKINMAVIGIDGVYERLFDYSSSSRHKTIPMGDYFGIGATYGKDQTTVATQVRGLHLIKTEKLPHNLGGLFYRLSGPQIMTPLREGEI